VRLTDRHAARGKCSPDVPPADVHHRLFGVNRPRRVSERLWSVPEPERPPERPGPALGDAAAVGAGSARGRLTLPGAHGVLRGEVCPWVAPTTGAGGTPRTNAAFPPGQRQRRTDRTTRATLQPMPREAGDAAGPWRRPLSYLSPSAYGQLRLVFG
jgi:hypothetical protein